MKRAIDRDRVPGRFLPMGSGNLLVMPQVSESLAGPRATSMTRREQRGEGCAGRGDELLAARDEAWSDLLAAGGSPGTGGGSPAEVMAIPDLTDAGLLPAGIHSCALDEIQERFGRFQSTDRRCRLFEALQVYVREAHSSGVAAWLVVDGSFVTGMPDPGDIDLVVVLPADHDFTSELRPASYNVVPKVRKF